VVVVAHITGRRLRRIGLVEVLLSLVELLLRLLGELLGLVHETHAVLPGRSGEDTAQGAMQSLSEGLLQMTEFRSRMATERDYSHRSTVQKLGVAPEQRVEITGDVGAGLRRDVKDAIGRGLVKSGLLDGAIVLVESEDEAKEAFVRYRPRLRDTGYLWMITRKRGHDRYLNQMALVPFAKRLGLIDNKTCSIDDERSGIRFVIPRALRRNGDQSAA
jgi:hypothetical protein